MPLAAFAADFPHGFFVDDLQRTPSVPAFYDLDTHHLQPVHLQNHYVQFIDFCWDRVHGKIFFSARQSAQEPFRIYVKDWPDGEEKPVFESRTGPFRFLLSPDGTRMALQVMGRSAWPTIGIYEWGSQQWHLLGQGYSPDWSVDSQRLLFLRIPDSLPSWLYEYRVDTDSATQVLNEPVTEAVYTDDPEQIILKTARQAAQYDIFEMYNRRTVKRTAFSPPEEKAFQKKSVSQRELAAFPGHQFFYFKESLGSTERTHQKVIVTDVWGGRYRSIPNSDWDPLVMAVDDTTLAMSEDPILVSHADGAGGTVAIPQTRFIRIQP